MKKRISKCMAILLCALTLLSSTSCSQAKGSESSKASSGSGSSGSKKVDLSLPISKEPLKLSYFAIMNGAMSATMSSYADVKCFDKIKEKTNIEISWIHPSSSSDEQFTLMIASNDLPDLINWKFGNAKGGAEALVKDKVLIPLTDKMETYAPNYNEIMNKNPEIKKTTQLNDGTMFQFINFNMDMSSKKIQEMKILGPYIRKDWLDKVNMQIPKTVDELYTVLKAFKDNDVNGDGDAKDEIPFVCGKNLEPIRVLAGAFGTRDSAHLKGGKVVYGPIQPEFKEYLETMNKWYKEGLINSDFPVLDKPDALILSNKAGFTYGAAGSGIMQQAPALKQQNQAYNLVSMPFIKGPRGQASEIYDSYQNPRATAISSSNKHVEESIRFLDYFYSQEGALISTFGIEGESFKMDNGYPKFTDLVLKSPQGYTQEEAIARYCVGPINFPYARDFRYQEQFSLDTDFKKQIQTDWKTATQEICMPPITLTTEESAKYSSTMADIKTYSDEMILKFIIGAEPISKFDEFTANIKKMGIDDAISIQQTALDRYNSK